MTRPAEAPVAVCSRGHRVRNFVPVECDGGHLHRIFTCRMRMGSRAHGEELVRPPFGPNCRDDTDEPG